MAASPEPYTLSIPNLSNFYSQGITHYLRGQGRRDWLDGCARDSTVGLLWGARDRAVLCPAPWDPSLVDDLERTLAFRLLIHRVPEDLTLTSSGLDLLAGRLREFDRGAGFRVAAWAPTRNLSQLVSDLSGRGVAIRDQERVIIPHWSQQYLNSKVGFRHLVQRGVPAPDVSLPPGMVCTHVRQACAAAMSLLRAGHERVILKADRGAGGFGQFILHSGVLNWDTQRQASLPRLAPLVSPMLSNSAIVVEAWVEHSQRPYATPSITMQVGDRGVDFVGTAATFMEFGATHAGAVVGNGAMPPRIERPLANLGQAVAREAHAIGYRGPMTIDAVIAVDDEVRLLEINARRTMVTHCHSLRRALFDGTRLGAVASYESTRIRGAELGSYAEVRRRLDGLWYRSGSGSGLFISLFAPRPEPDRELRLSFVAISRNASTAVDLLRQGFTCLSVEVPAPLENAWRQLPSEAAG